jgi:hypothetical protein
MAIKSNILKNLTNVQMMKFRLSSQKGRFTKLEKRVAKLQALVKDDILSITDKTSEYKGNAYPTYSNAVAEINKKYNGTADWGVLQTGSIIDLRAAFVINEGIKVVAKEGEAVAELEWANRFLEYNNIDNEVAQEYAKEAEIEGKIAIKLAVEEKDIDGKEEKETMISARYISWTDKKYTIKTNPQDYMDYQELTWMPKDKTKEETLNEKEFIYKKFGGRINEPNTAAPKIMKCLTQIENLDKALRDWREIDNIFASPILGVECKTKEDAKSASEALKDKNWKIKKLFVSTAKLYYTQFDIKGIESLEKEIVTLAKMISGTTGIPVGALGLPELMSNRATAENLMEFVLMATSKERQIWIGAYEEIIRNSMIMYNEKVNAQMSDAKKLNPDLIKVEIPVVTAEQWLHLEKIFLPAAVAGKVSDELFLGKIPGVDVDKEMGRKAEKEVSEIERAKKENADLIAEREINDIFSSGENNDNLQKK